MKLATTRQMRELDRRTIEEFGTPGEVLMDRAGQGVADAVAALMDLAGWRHPSILLLAGRGNNGGDAFAAARWLHEMDYRPEVWLASEANQVQGDALKHMSRMKAAGVPLHELPTVEDWEDTRAAGGHADVLVDGLLGTGSSGMPRGPVAGAIRYIKERADRSHVVAIDVPSGLNADTGEAEGDAVEADLTVTMGLPKAGMLAQSAVPYVGTLDVVDIGLPPEYVEEARLGTETELINWRDLEMLFPRRPRTAHKGDFGRALLIGGARGYAGAISMAARSAVRSGAGLVSAVVPEGIVPIVAGASLETMVSGAQETDQGCLAAGMWSAWRGRVQDYDAMLVGPGMSRDPEIFMLVRSILRDVKVPLVVDADAISVFAKQAQWFGKAEGRLVLTPHAGELARLLGKDVAEIQADRRKAALAAVEATGATIILKGAGTVVAAKDKPVCINLTGNPGMATGGSGDVLAGLLVGLLAQGLEPFDAARAAVYLHGRAGDLAALRRSQAGLTACDIIEEISYAFRDVSLR
ncbi:MAG: NAD(P)H-hydrate dehydratase [Kiritimatiellae bacterium]|nr:NAD(P)H-hydrate dehydratase [Kiritimatiellia bacterium]